MSVAHNYGHFLSFLLYITRQRSMILDRSTIKSLTLLHEQIEYLRISTPLACGLHNKKVADETLPEI
jgi:hypothetical protein